MGFRCVFVTQSTCLEIPASFHEKYKKSYHFYEYNGKFQAPICSKAGYKGHDEIIEDLQKILPQGKDLDCTQIWECGGVEKVLITSDKIVRLTLEHENDWYEDGYHSYCGYHFFNYLDGTPRTKESRIESLRNEISRRGTEIAEKNRLIEKQMKALDIKLNEMLNQPIQLPDESL